MTVILQQPSTRGLDSSRLKVESLNWKNVETPTTQIQGHCPCLSLDTVADTLKFHKTGLQVPAHKKSAV